jgi:Xaa-Pro dipeptidase
VVAPIRQRLGEAEIARYRALGRDAAEALESALLEVTPGWSELHVAAAMAAEMLARDIDPVVLLVGSGERTLRFRHLVPVDTAVAGTMIASATAVRHGLHASLTRSIAYGIQPAVVRDRHLAAANVDAMYLSRSRPGARLGEVLEAGEQVYEFTGYYDDWKEHHQGGITGYAGREVFATPGSETSIGAGSAVAWNPTVPGAKSEDTALVGEAGLELLTTWPDSPWPVLIPEHAPGVPRLGLLQVD